MNLDYEGLIAVLGSDRAVVWTEDPARLGISGRAAPLHNILHLWFLRYGLHLLHAGAVGLDGNGAIIVGPGGSGKSTTAMACLAAGFEFLSDDYTLTGLDPVPRAVNLYRSAKLVRNADQDLLDRLPPSVNRDDIEDKALYLLESGVCSALTLSSILVPRLVDRDTSAIVPIGSPVEAMIKLAPTSILQLPGADAESLRFMRQLCESLPTLGLDIGRNHHHLAEVVRGLLTT